jgi:hypothetical protein
MLLNFIFIIAIVMSYCNGMNFNTVTLTSNPTIECSSETGSLNSEVDFSVDDQINPIRNVFFFSSKSNHALDYNDNNLIIESMFAHWQPPKV